MSPLRARVQNGRLVLDEPTTLPDGMVIDLVADDEGDDLTDQERKALHDGLSAHEDGRAAEGDKPSGGKPVAKTSDADDPQEIERSSKSVE